MSLSGSSCFPSATSAIDPDFLAQHDGILARYRESENKREGERQRHEHPTEVEWSSN